jgi:hypothetical protein
VRDATSRTSFGLFLAAALVACGARTGLWIDVASDGGRDAEPDAPSVDSGPGDAALDAPFDVTFDAPLDAPADVIADVSADSQPQEAGDACVGVCPCPPGTMAVGSSCLPIVGSTPAPRPLSPLSTARVTRGTPVFTWQLAPGDDGAVVECCADRACTQITETFLAPGTHGSPGTPLPSGVSFWRLLGTSNGSVGSVPSATWEVLVPVGGSAKAQTWWGSILDLDGDGLADVGVTAVIYGDRYGDAYVYSSQRGVGPASTAVELDGPPTQGNEYGCTIDSAGDVNGDGFGDLVVGQCDLDKTAGASGAAYVYLGSPTGISTTATVLPQPLPNIAFGYAAASAGDANGDGYGDLVVGAADGVAYLYLGGPSGIGTTPTPLPGALGSESGTAFGAADVNGDGWGDLVLGGSNNNALDGAASLYLGTPTGLSTTPVALPGPPAGSGAAYGSEIAVGDINADGYADVLIGAFLFDHQSGEGLLFMGGPGGLDSPPIVLANPHGSNSGRFTDGLACVHDVNGDGFDDFVVGAYLDGGNVGAAWLYLGGPAGLSMPIPLAIPSGALAYFGNAVAGGDADGDGYADVVVGCEGIGLNPGGAFWFRGGSGGLTMPTPLMNPHPAAAGIFGWSLAM